MDTPGNYSNLSVIYYLMVDADADGMDDRWEILYGLNPAVDDSGEDPDGDGLSNLGEFQYNSNPTQVDTDSDGLGDGARSTFS